MILFYIALPLLLFYVLLICIYHIGWLRIKPFKYIATNAPLTFSIIIPARNEEKLISRCVTNLLQQKYPKHLFEIIVVNDHSVDNTKHEVENIITANPYYQITLVNMSNDEEKRYMKKAAITHAIAHAKNQYIILTDADCTRGVNWLETIDSFIQHKQSKMVYAPVEFNANNMFEKIQSLEFAGLVGIGGAAIQLKNPNMCSAANLVFEKMLFNEIDGYQGNENIASGDDEFLLHKAFKVYPNHIHFLKNCNAIVQTTANHSLKQLSDQRRRWVSKSTKYENRYITAILVGAYLFNLLLFLNLIVNFKLGVLLLAIKAITEGLFLYNVMKFYKNKSYLWLLPIAEVFHIMYVIIIGVWANVGTYNWKGRNVK